MSVPFLRLGKVLSVIASDIFSGPLRAQDGSDDLCLSLELL